MAQMITMAQLSRQKKWLLRYIQREHLSIDKLLRRKRGQKIVNIYDTLASDVHT